MDQVADIDVDVDEEIVRLAGLNLVEYDRERQGVAKRLKIRVSTLDVAVKKMRNEVSAGQGPIFDVFDIWPEPVDGADVLNKVADVLNKYVVLPQRAADAIALWVMHTHAYSAFIHTPRLNITAPEKGCGKTLVLDILQTLCPRALRTENVSTAVLFRITDQYQPVLLVDEYDSFLMNNEELRGALNAGHKRGGVIMRCDGDANEVKMFKTFSPVALAGIKALPATLHDRSIVIRMKRAMVGELRQQFDMRYTYDENILRAKLARWCEDNIKSLENIEPSMPEGLFNRKADKWRPLLAIAETVGQGWIEKAVEAIAYLEATDDDDETAGVMLLADFKKLMDDKGLEKIHSENLVRYLNNMEDRPWPEWSRDKPITKRQVAKLLKPFGIKPCQVRIGELNRQGYRLEDMIDAFNRYLLDICPTSLQPSDCST